MDYTHELTIRYYAICPEHLTHVGQVLDRVFDEPHRSTFGMRDGVTTTTKFTKHDAPLGWSYRFMTPLDPSLIRVVISDKILELKHRIEVDVDLEWVLIAVLSHGDCSVTPLWR